MRRESQCAERADAAVGERVLGVVAVMEDERALRQEEGEEPGADEPGHGAAVADRVERLRQHVEERDRDDDPARQGDQRLELAASSHGDQAAADRGDGRQRSERDGDPGGRRDHAAQRPQVP